MINLVGAKGGRLLHYLLLSSPNERVGFAKQGVGMPKVDTLLIPELIHGGVQGLLHPTKKEPKSIRHGPCQIVNEAYAVKPHYEELFAACFHAVVESMALYGFNTRLNRFDLFHGHLFVTSSQTAGILFHCYEYPNGETILPGIPLGYCAANSDCAPTIDEWSFRNVLWVLGQTSSLVGAQMQAVWLLDGKSPEISTLRIDSEPFGPNCPNTIWEGSFGTVVSDVFYDERGGLLCGNVGGNACYVH